MSWHQIARNWLDCWGRPYHAKSKTKATAAGLQRCLGLFGLCTGKHMQPSSNLYRQALKIHDLVHYLAKQSYLDLFSVSLLSTLVAPLLVT